MIAVVAAPEILKRCKPFAKTLGDLLVEAGKEIHKLGEVEEPVVTPTPAPEPVPESEPASEPESEPAPEPEAPKARKKKDSPTG
jgi:hypothetical protein